MQPAVFYRVGLAKYKTLLVIDVAAIVCITFKFLKPSSGGFDIVAKLGEFVMSNDFCITKTFSTSFIC